MFAGAARRILDDANSREKSSIKGLCPLQRIREEAQFFCGHQRNLCVKEIRRDSTPPVRKNELIQEIRVGGLQGTEAAHPAWPAHQSRRSPGEMRFEEHFRLTAKKEREVVLARCAREFEVKGKLEERTQRESVRRRREVADLLVLSKSAESWQNGAGFSGKT